MQVKKFINSTASQIHMLETGDVFRTDSSYVVTGISNNDTQLDVRQSIFRHPDTGQDHTQFDAPTCDNVSYSPQSRNCTLDEILRVKQISIRDKFFVVSDIEYIRHGKGHKVTAIESNALGKPVKEGISIQFYQAGFSGGQVTFPNYVSHNNDFAVLKDKTPKVA